MPLVTRTSIQGSVYKDSSEPSNWQDGDIWVDTTNDIVYHNVAGTASAVGKTIQELLVYG